MVLRATDMASAMRDRKVEESRQLTQTEQSWSPKNCEKHLNNPYLVSFCANRQVLRIGKEHILKNNEWGNRDTFEKE